MLYAFYALFFSLICFLFLHKVFELTRRLIPKQFATAEITAQLKASNKVLIGLYTLYFILIVFHFFFLGILVFILPSRNSEWIRIAFGIETIKYPLLSIAVIYQLQRCIIAMNRSAEQTKAILSNEDTEKLGKTIHLFKVFQFLYFIFAVPMMFVYAFVAIGIIPPDFIVALIYASVGMISNFLFVFAFNKSGKRERKEGSKSGNKSTAKDDITSDLTSAKV